MQRAIGNNSSGFIVLVKFLSLIANVGGFERASEYVYSKHPPHKKDRNDGPRNVNKPVSRGFRFSKIEHAAMVAGPRRVVELNHELVTLDITI